MSRYLALCQRTAETVGITINGPGEADVAVHDNRFYQRVAIAGSLGLGESYMEGWWTSKNLSETFYRLSQVDDRVVPTSAMDKLQLVGAWLINMQTIARAKRSIETYYDLGNDFMSGQLGTRMVASCAYWKDAKDLDDAQERKLDLICKKLRLQPNDRLLDIGCGWGSLVRFAAERYGVTAVGVTNSPSQATFARESCRDLPVTIHLRDYREIPEAPRSFSKIASVGMFEHVGPRNYRTFFRVVDSFLKSGGLTLLHTMGGNVSCLRCDPWINKYIFPDGVVPSVTQLGHAIEGRFVVEDWHCFGPYYYRTFMSWYERFCANWDPSTIKTSLPPEKFFRMWEYYLVSFGSTFRTRRLNVWQIVLSRIGEAACYESIR